MAGRRSREKGARGERAVIAMLKSALGVHSHRTQQHQSGGGSPLGDLDADTIKDRWFFNMFHVEVKNDEQKTVWAAIKQASDDSDKAAISRPPVVFMHKNNKPWIVVMLVDDWFDLVAHWRDK